MTQRYAKFLIVCFLLVVFFVQAIISMVQKAPTADEAAHHIATGYSFLKTKDFRLNSTGPPLMEELSAIPLLFMKDLRLPLDHPSWANIQRTAFAEQFLYVDNKDSHEKIVFWTRIPMVLTGVFLGLLVFLWSNRLYGFKSGVFALFLYAFSPTILAHTRLVTMDIGASCFIFLAVFCFYLYCRKPSFVNLILSGIAFGLAQLSKYTAVYLYLLYLIFFLLIWFFSKRDYMMDYKVSRNLKKFLFNIVFIFLIGNSIVFCGYFFEFKPLLLNDVDVGEKIAFFEGFITKIFGSNSIWLKEKFTNFAINQPVPFSTYIMGFLSASNQTFVEHRFPFMLFGNYSMTGWWYYYLVVFLLKTSFPILILLIIAIVFARGLRKNKMCELFTTIPVILLMILTMFSVLSGGVRYILPIYPFLFVYISKVINVNVQANKGFVQRRLACLFILILCFCHLFSSVRVFPHYIPYSNILAGGPRNGYKCLTWVNTDLGQELKGLAKYLDENDISRVKLCYGIFTPPETYNINYLPIEDIEKEIPEQEVYAISAPGINAFKWADKYKPRHMIGYTIFIYDFRFVNFM